MKRITVSCPIVLNTKAGAWEFRPGETYEVSNEVAAHPYLSQHLASEVNVPQPKAAKATKASPQKQDAAQEADDGEAADA